MRLLKNIYVALMFLSFSNFSISQPLDKRYNFTFMLKKSDGSFYNDNEVRALNFTQYTIQRKDFRGIYEIDKVLPYDENFDLVTYTFGPYVGIDFNYLNDTISTLVISSMNFKDLLVFTIGFPNREIKVFLHKARFDSEDPYVYIIKDTDLSINTISCEKYLKSEIFDKK
jgi:hypothetical protein